MHTKTMCCTANLLRAFTSLRTTILSGFSFRLDSPDGTSDTLGANDVMRKWNLGERYIKLPSGGFAKLPSSWLNRHGDKLTEVMAALNMAKGNRPAYLAPLIEDFFEDLGEKQPPVVEAWLSTVEAPPPCRQRRRQSSGISCALISRSALKWLQERLSMGMGTLLADDMGLGKTLQTMSVLQAPVLIVAPTSVAFNWVRELARFRPDLKVNHYRGPKRKLDDAEVTVTSYALLRIDEEKLSQVDWTMAVLDESQAIKNPAAR